MSVAGPVLADIGEDDLLALIFPQLASGPGVLVGPGDDTALLAAKASVLATTDAMVRGRDWRDEWSTGADVGAKAVAQNVADIAAMGGVATALLVVLLAEPATPVAWVQDFTAGLAAAAADAGVPVVGGDLSSAGEGVLAVTVTALGDLQGRPAVLRSGAQVGDVLAVCGSLGRSAAGLLLLERGQSARDPELVRYHCRPRPPYEAGPVAARAGATSMIDLSDGLGRDAGRVARASGVRIRLERSALAADVAALEASVGGESAWRCVVSGGEEHSLLATFTATTGAPAGWRVVGDVRIGADVVLDDQVLTGSGWDHFGG